MVLARVVLVASGLLVGSSAGAESVGRLADLHIRDIAIVSAGHFGVPGPTSVLVQNGIITYIGDAVAGRTSDSTIVIDGQGRFLSPGLIDGHTHLNEVPGMTFEHEEKDRLE